MKPEVSKKWITFQPFMLSVMMVIGIMIGYKMNERKDYALIDRVEDEGRPPLIGRVEELIRFVENRYVDNIDSEELLDEALNSVFSKLDPHSVYIPPSELEDINDQMNGEFYGIGIETYMIRDTVFICGILDQSPAFDAGLKMFDKILMVNDSVVAGKKMEFEAIRNMLRNHDQSSVQLLIGRGSSKIKVSVSPSRIPVSTVTSSFTIRDTVSYVSLDRFSSNTYKEFMEALETAFDKGKAKHLIIDLRNNPGGYLPEATNILCQIFEEKNRLLVYTEGRNNKRNEYKSTGKRFFNIDKVAVLIDENSASASEIIAGAIQDWDRGVLIGRRSFGKGLVQEQYDLNNGGAVRLTVARYYTPSGRCIQKEYGDTVDYDSDIHNRFTNGQLFNQEEENTSVNDSSSYRSLILNRKLYASGGIYPDIFVPLDSMFLSEDMIEIESVLPEYVFKNLYEGKIKSQISLNTIENFIIPTDFYEGLEKYAQIENHYNSKLLSSRFDKTVKYYMIKFMLNKAEASKYNSESDQFIQSALKHFASGTSLKEL